MTRMTSGALFLFLHPQMLCLPWEGVQARALQWINNHHHSRSFPTPPHPPFIHQLLGGDGSHLARGPEDPGFSACRLERGGGGDGMRVWIMSCQCLKAFIVQKRVTKVSFPGKAG